jgi:hypothetical protein
MENNSKFGQHAVFALLKLKVLGLCKRVPGNNHVNILIFLSVRDSDLFNRINKWNKAKLIRLMEYAARTIERMCV